MGARTEILKLGSGAQIAFDQYGDPNGKPVLFCHGWPSSRTMAQFADDAARDVGARIISPDRPGLSRSSFAPKRKLLDWPAVAQELMTSLRIPRFHVIGISGGAPYAYATAWALPEQVPAIAVVSGAVPISDLADQSGLLKLYRWMLALRSRQPLLLRSCFHIARPFASVRLPIRFRPLLLKLLQPVDAEVLRESRAFEACFESQRRAWRGSARGVIADAEIYAQPWGFRLEDIHVPVRLWHGTADRSFSYRLAEEIAPRIPNCSFRLVEGAGHYSLPIRQIGEILADLIAT